MKTPLLSACLFAGTFFVLGSFATAQETTASPIASNLKALEPAQLLELVGKEVKDCPSCAPEIVKAVIDQVGINSPVLPDVIKTAVQSHPNPAVCYDVVVRTVGEKLLGLDAKTFLGDAIKVDPRGSVQAEAVQAERALFAAPTKDAVRPLSPPTPPAPDVSRS